MLARAKVGNKLRLAALRGIARPMAATAFLVVL
jgi:hypothetical protein